MRNTGLSSNVSVSPVNSQNDPIQVLYISGAGRSGSTLLGNILGQYPGFFHAGELWYLWDRGLIENQRCGCGERLGDCQEWHRILNIFQRELGSFSPERVVRLRERFLHLRSVPMNSLSGKYDNPTGDFQELLIVLKTLYRSIQKATGCKVIVDSSKYPSYGYSLRRMPDIDAKIVHLVRDPRAVAFSWMRSRSHTINAGGVNYQYYNPWMSGFLWLMANSSTEFLCDRAPRAYLRVKYNTLTEHTSDVLGGILSRFYGSSEHRSVIRDKQVELAPVHTVSGNPMRLKHGILKIQNDDEWKSLIKPTDRWIVSALTWPLLLHYGFELGQSTGT
jgi:hypothetical protein